MKLMLFFFFPLSLLPFLLPSLHILENISSIIYSLFNLLIYLAFIMCQVARKVLSKMLKKTPHKFWLYPEQLAETLKKKK